jgi:hypothetical protein
MPPPERWLAVGATFVTAGAGGAAVYWVYGRQASPHVGFWHLPGYVSGGVLALGLVALVIGFFGRGGRRDGHGDQHQQGGDGSTNLQAGGDIRIGSERKS